MTGSCRRLLAAFSLIFMAVTGLCGQDAAGHEILTPNWYLWKDGPIIPRDGLPATAVPPGRYPVVHYPPVSGTTFQLPIFQQLVRNAGIIFSGHVTFVGHIGPSSGQSPASTMVTFHVEQAIRGSSTGQSLTIHEWAGLWASGERYRLGERVLLFLYAPSKLGLTSPVSGAMGRFTVDSEGNVVMSRVHISTLAADPILGGRAVLPYRDFAIAVRNSAGGR